MTNGKKVKIKRRANKEEMTEIGIDREKSRFVSMRSFHNIIKRNLILETVKLLKKRTINLFDISVGRMGDYHSWNNAQISYVFGIDPDKESILEAKRRYIELKKNNKSITNVDFAVCKITDDKINLTFPKSKLLYDIVQCQFTIHYFFENQEMLDNALRRVEVKLKPGGYFIGTAIDGDKVNRVLNKNPSIKNKYFMIQKEYTEYTPFGSKYQFCLFDKPGSGNYFNNISSVEYLVPQCVLTQACKHFGLHLVAYKNFSDIYEECGNSMISNQYEKDISFMYYTFVFQKK